MPLICHSEKQRNATAERVSFASKNKLRPEEHNFGLNYQPAVTLANILQNADKSTNTCITVC